MTRHEVSPELRRALKTLRLGKLLDTLPERLRMAREQKLDQLLPRSLRPIDLLELQGGGQVLRVEREDPLVDVGRAIAVADLVLPHRRRLQQHLDLRRRIVERARLLLEDADALLPARLLREQLLERPERAEVAIVQLQNALPGLDRLLRPHQDLALQRAQLVVELDELVRIHVRRRADVDQLG